MNYTSDAVSLLVLVSQCRVSSGDALMVIGYCLHLSEAIAAHLKITTIHLQSPVPCLLLSESHFCYMYMHQTAAVATTTLLITMCARSLLNVQNVTFLFLKE